MISARDIREFRGFLRNASDRQVQGIYDKEKSAGRDEYAELAVAEADRRGIFLEQEDHARKKAHVCRTAACKKSHAHATKKSSAQLQHEIDEVLASPGSFSYEEAMAALEKKHAGVKRGGSLRAGHAPVAPKMSAWSTRVFNTHHAAQGFLNRIKKRHVAVIEEHGASQWRVAYLPEGKGMPLNK